MSNIGTQLRKNLKHNVIVNLADGAFFGLGLGFSSYSTIIPLFVSQLTTSAILIGLIPAIHSVGWQLPQLFTANATSQLRRYKPTVIWTTIHERLPLLALALLAWFLPSLGTNAVLVLTFVMLIWQGLGAGFTANAWQSMISKIIPSDSRGTFLGAQAGIANLVIFGAAIAAGYTLDWLDSPIDFALCFLISAAAYAISMIFLGFTREPVDDEKELPPHRSSIFDGMGEILRRDRNFAWFLVMRIVFQFATMGFAFYIVYALRKFEMDEITAGYLTATLTFSQAAANVAMGWLGDRFGHRLMLIVGMFAVTASSLMAWGATSLAWFYPIFIIEGLANVAFWTIGMAMTAEFAGEAERPIYIGMSNTLSAPATILAPIIGGWIADVAGYPTMFMISAIGGLVTAAIIIFFIKDPRHAAAAPGLEAA